MASESAQPAGARQVVMLTQDRHIDRRILLEAESLEAAGWSVTILAMPPDEAGHHADDPKVVRIGARADGGNLPRRESLVLAMYRTARRRLPMNGRFIRRLKQFAWRYVVKQDSFFLKLFEPTVLQHPAAIYVAHDLPMLPAAARASERLGAKLVYDSHELYAEQEFSPRERRAWMEVERTYIGRCDAVITVNPSIARELQSRYGVADVSVVYNAERAASAPRRGRLFHDAFGLGVNDRVLLFQGGLSAGRNIDVLVKAMRHVRSGGVHLVILGDGALKARLRSLVASGLQDRVHLHDAVPQAELVSWSASADAGVIPYQATCLNNYYCTPNKLFEFIAAGLPILGSDLPEIRNIVEGSGIGRVADLSGEERVAAAIDAFFADPAQLQAWRAAAQAAREDICWEAEGRKVVRIFEALR